MLQFNELRLTADNKCLIIDVSVQDIAYFEGVTIDSIAIDTQDTWIPNGPSSKAVIVYTPEFKVMDIIQDASGRHVRIEVQKPLLDMSNKNMYFVYAIADPSNAPEATQAPCTCSNEKIMGTVVNNYYLYDTLMNGIRELADDCSKYKNFSDSFLRMQAVDAGIKAGNYPLAIKYWNMFFSGEVKKSNSKPCGCHGRY